MPLASTTVSGRPDPSRAVIWLTWPSAPVTVVKVAAGVVGIRGDVGDAGARTVDGRDQAERVVVVAGLGVNVLAGEALVGVGRPGDLVGLAEGAERGLPAQHPRSSVIAWGAPRWSGWT